MTIYESTHLSAQSELLKALAEHAISFTSEADANAAGFSMNDGSLTGNGSHGVVLQYIDPYGKQSTGFYRMRYTTPLPNPQNPAKSIKYKQPSGSRVQAYFPSCVNWMAVVHDVSTPIVITEGEYKAFSASQNLGIPTIGLGGVSSYKDKLTLGTLLDSLAAINWKDRLVYIAYDSDTADNENVVSASFRLAEALSGKHAVPMIVTLPMGPNGEKQGLDDFILNTSSSYVAEYLRSNAKEPALSEHLRRFAKQCICVDELLGYIDVPTGTISTQQKMITSIYAAHKVTKRLPNGKSVAVNLFKEYCEWPARTSANVLRSYPGKPRFFTQEVSDDATRAGTTVLNAWIDTRPERRKGDVAAWLAWVRHMLINTPELEPYLHAWIATLLQKPCKMQTAWVFYSPMTGTGKSTLGYVLSKLVGPSAAIELSSDDLEDELKTNRMLIGKQLVLADDISSHTSRKDADTLKNTITRKKARVNLKYVNPFDALDYRNWIFSTNHPDAMKIDRFDRRFFFVEVPKVKFKTNPSVPNISHFFTNEGAGELLDFYMEYQVPEWFDETTEPPQSESRTAAIETSMSAIELWVNDLKEGSTTYTGCTVFDAVDLAALAFSQGYAMRPVSPVYMTNVLKAADVTPSAFRINISTATGQRKKTLYCFNQVLSADNARQTYEQEATARLNLLAGALPNIKC